MDLYLREIIQGKIGKRSIVITVSTHSISAHKSVTQGMLNNNMDSDESHPCLIETEISCIYYSKYPPFKTSLACSRLVAMLSSCWAARCKKCDR